MVDTQSLNNSFSSQKSNNTNTIKRKNTKTKSNNNTKIRNNIKIRNHTTFNDFKCDILKTKKCKYLKKKIKTYLVFYKDVLDNSIKKDIP